MFPGDSHGGGRLGLPGRLALLASLALACWLGGNRVTRIEYGFYDLLQRATAGPGSGRIIILATDDGPSDPWSRPDLPGLLRDLRQHGALAIVPALPPPNVPAEADVSRLAGLVDLERRTAGDGSPRLRTLGRQLEEAEGRHDGMGAVAREMAEAGNVVVGLEVRKDLRSHDAAPQACLDRIAAASPSYAALLAPGALAGSPVGASAEICAAAAAVAYLGASPDEDGIVRRFTPAVATPAGALPAAAFTMARQGTAGGSAPMGAMPEVLTRFYAGNDGTPPFRIFGDEALGADSGSIRGRFVVIGPTEASSGQNSATPVSATTPAAILVATRLSNILEHSYVARPAWAFWFEGLLALFLAAGLSTWGHRQDPVGGATAALAGASLLLILEGLLFVAGGLWIQLVSLAVFAVLGTGLAQALRAWPPRRPAGSGGGDAAAPAMPAAGGGPGAELDLAFSVLRQQPTNEQTKQKLYDLAMEHGRNRDYARAERVFRHLAGRDPAYRDVASKLEKLSGARGAVLPRGAEASAAKPAAPAATNQGPAVRTLGRYELERIIGRGAMATVYLGRDPTINRRVAIKTVPLAEEFAESDLVTARNSFMREAESSGRLNHPNIISIYDAGEDQHVAYLAMEYFEGQPLSHFAQLGRLLPPRKVFDLMARAADALEYAHSQNVVHRDVKPANILYHPATDTLKLTDFGIARLTDASRTRTGIILGTPSYMSPEQLSASRVSGQSDLYSLGVTLYHLLTGSPPFQADSIPKLMQKIALDRHRPVRDLRDDIPPCVDAILDRALSKDPASRFPTGKAMALALRECCSTFPADNP